MPYTAPDFLDVDSLLTDEERVVRDTVRSFVDERIMPDISRHFEEGTFPSEIVREMGELGLLGANIEGYGCAGMGDIAYGVICRELERGDSGIRSFASVQGSLVMYPIRNFGSEEQKQRWLPRLAKGEAIGCFGLTEPDFGSDPGGMITTAKPTADGWVLNGAKMWITNGSVSDVAVVWAKTPEGIRGFLVERGAKGFTAPDIDRKWSLRASHTSELVFDDVRLPKDAILPGTKGLVSALHCLNSARYGIAWGAVGAAQACYDEALTHAKTRVVYGKPIGRFQMVQNKLVEMLTAITNGQLMAWRLGSLKEAGKSHFTQVSMAKRHNVKMALDAARTTRDILGASGITHEYVCGRHAANLESVITYEGTHDIHMLIVGMHVTGLNALGNE
ncbi:MAG: Acyl-CoA dehydrogenase, short-chain specific [Planctomycetes bacterium]|nr:Acyl-CoA dehydrogenase, short-chain specific [Planctomycetota bacterium]